MLTTVAVLVIVLGLMVSLARDVRNRSAEQVTKDMLARLDRMMAQYADRHAQQLPAVTALIPPAPANTDPMVVPPQPTADELLRAAKANNADFSRALRPHATLNDANPSFFDAWGNPVVFMPRQHPLIGMAGGDRFFFFSPGPDGRFLTREDNLYSYEMGGE